MFKKNTHPNQQLWVHCIIVNLFMRTSKSSNVELIVSIVPQSATTSVLRTVQRSRMQPMGQYQKMSIQHINTQCSVVQVRRENNAKHTVMPGTVFVLDFDSQRTGRLYRARDASSKTDILTNTDIVYDVWDIQKMSNTGQSSAQYLLKVGPYQESAPLLQQQNPSGHILSWDQLPIWGSTLTIYFVNHTQHDGRVVWIGDDYVDVQVLDTFSSKIWIRIVYQTDETKSPELVEYRLSESESEDGSSYWHLSRTTMTDTLDRIQYPVQPTQQANSIALRQHLARASPHGFGHVYFVHATTKRETLPGVQGQRDTCISVSVSQTQLSSAADVEGLDNEHSYHLPSSYPWSPTYYMDLAFQQKPSKNKLVSIPLEIQPSASVYRSWLFHHEYETYTRTHASYQVLLPSAYDLYKQHPLKSCLSIETNALWLTVTGVEIQKKLNYILSGYPLGKGIQVIISDVLTLNRITKPGFQSVRVKTNRIGANRLIRLLLGQAIVTVETNSNQEKSVQSNAQRDMQVKHGERALAYHWSHMGEHWQYRIEDNMTLWKPSVFHTPIVHGGPPSTHPLPLIHTSQDPLASSTAEQRPFALKINPSVYWPLHDPFDAYETANHCLRKIRPEPYSHIVHKTIDKQMSGTGFKALVDIEELRNPSWCNVEATDEVDTVAMVQQAYDNQPSHPSGIPCIAVEHGVHHIPCDDSGQILHQYYTRFPHEQLDESRIQTCKPILQADAHSWNTAALDLLEGKDLIPYGVHPHASSQLPSLSHFLYGTHERPHRGVGATYQRKPLSVQRSTDEYLQADMFDVRGVYAQPRWITTRKVVQSLQNISSCQLMVKGHSQTVDLVAHGFEQTTTYTIATICNAWTHALQTTYPEAGFSVTINKQTHGVTIAARVPFTIQNGFETWGIPSNTEAHTEDANSNDPIFRVHSEYEVHWKRTLRDVENASVAHVETAKVVRLHLVSKDAVNDDEAPVTVSCQPYYGEPPFEDARESRYLTSPGRATVHRYTSVPLHGRPLHVAFVNEHLVVIRCHCATLLRDGRMVQQVPFAWPEAKTAPSWTVETVVDASKKHTSWNVTHHPSLTTCTIRVEDKAKPVLHTDYNTLAKGPNRSKSTLCCTHTTTIRGTIKHELRTACHPETGCPMVHIWKTLVNGPVSSEPELVRSIQLEASALAAIFVQQTHVLVCDASQCLTLHSINRSDPSPPSFQSHFPKRFNNTTCIPNVEQVCCLNMDTNETGLRFVVGYDGRSAIYQGVCAKAQTSVLELQRCRVLLTGNELNTTPWDWRVVECRGLHTSHQAIDVLLESFKSLQAISQSDCKRYLDTCVREKIEHWFAAPLDTLHVQYLFSNETGGAVSELMQFIVQDVIGHSSLALSRTFKQHLARHVASSSKVIVNPRDIVRSYCAQTSTCYASDNEHMTDDLRRVEHVEQTHIVDACSQYLTSLTQQFNASKSDAPTNQQSPPKSTSSVMFSEKSRSAVFYAKMVRLLKDNVEGIPYVQRVYQRSYSFREHFKQCKDFCYQRLLCKCRELNIDGHGRRVWSDEHRDSTTFLAEGEAHHLCMTCGEQVCRQDGGLTLDYDAMGMSSTHSEHQQNQRDEEDVSNELMQVTELTSMTLQSDVPIEQMLRRLGIYGYRPKLDALVIIEDVYKLFPEGKHIQLHDVKRNGSTVIHLQKAIDAKHGGVILHIYECAAEALLFVLHKHEALGARTLPQTRSLAKERNVIRAFEQQLQFEPEELLVGIPPRPYFRPHMSQRVNPLTTPKEANGWCIIDTIINNIGTSTHILFDASTLDTASTEFAQRDQYISTPFELHDTSKRYTSISQMMDPSVNSRCGDISAVKSRLEFIRIYPWTRLCNILAPNAHTVLPVSPTPSSLIYEMTWRTQPRNPLVMMKTRHKLSDTERRETIAKRVQRCVDTPKGHYAYPIQVLIDHKHLLPDDATTLLKWIVGISATKRFKITSHPPTDFRMKPAWMQYYEQLVSDNKIAEELVKGCCCRVVS